MCARANLALLCLFCFEMFAGEVNPQRGSAKAEVTRPAHFPHRIWAASDFETPLPDYAWFGKTDATHIPNYPGNATAVRGTPYNNCAVMAGMNPVPGPCMGKVNYMYCRYFLKGETSATFQHFSLTREDNNHIRVSGLTESKWSELTLNFTRDAARNDGSAEAFKEGERMDDLKIFVGKKGQEGCELLIDDVIFFAEDPNLPAETEPFPNRVLFVAGFDTGISGNAVKDGKYKYFPGDLEAVSKNLPEGAYWGAARAVPQKKGKGRMITLQIEPPKPVGAHTKLRFRFYLTGASQLRTQIFDATDQDNRHVDLSNLEQKKWKFIYVDFTRDGKRNDGSNTPFAAGHKVDDLFFFVEPDGAEPVELLIDEVVLFDAGEAK